MFWAVAILVAGAVAALIVLALLGRGQDTPAAASDVQVYRDQLDEVERDLAKGIIPTDEADRLRTEVSRRLIEAAKHADAADPVAIAPKGVTRVVALLSVLVVVGGGLGVYGWLGAPGYSDLSMATRIEMADRARATRPSQEIAEEQAAAALQEQPKPTPDPAFGALMERLRMAMEQRPDDIQGFRLLARNEAGLGNFAAAARAQTRLVTLLGDKATASDFGDKAEYLVFAAGGYVSPEAETALVRALNLDGGNGRARYYSALLYSQTGRPDLAFRLWRDLLEAGPEDAPWIAPIRAQIDRTAALAGVRYDVPEPALDPAFEPGPSAEDVENAAGMAPDDRDAMIRGMVSGLADRLAREGGPATDWARLISAYGVLGETETAAAILSEARETFKADDTAMAALRDAASRAGLE